MKILAMMSAALLVMTPSLHAQDSAANTSTPAETAAETPKAKSNAKPAEQNMITLSPEITFYSNDALKQSGTPFSTAVEVDGWIYLAGMLGTQDGALVSGGITPETRQAMERSKAELAQRDVGMDRIVRCLVILADFDDFAAFNAAYKVYFDGKYPARSTFAAKTLAANARVEIECTARR